MGPSSINGHPGTRGAGRRSDGGEARNALCPHVLEHVIDLVPATQELLRIARERLLIVVSRQRYYYFTLDEHVNFFWQHEVLTYHFQGHKVEVTLAGGGDWALSVAKTRV